MDERVVDRKLKDVIQLEPRRLIVMNGSLLASKNYVKETISVLNTNLQNLQSQLAEIQLELEK